MDYGKQAKVAKLLINWVTPDEGNFLGICELSSKDVKHRLQKCKLKKHSKILEGGNDMQIVYFYSYVPGAMDVSHL